MRFKKYRYTKVTTIFVLFKCHNKLIGPTAFVMSITVLLKALLNLVLFYYILLYISSISSKVPYAWVDGPNFVIGALAILANAIFIIALIAKVHCVVIKAMKTLLSYCQGYLRSSGSIWWAGL